MSVIDKGFLGELFKDTAYISTGYGKSLRDNFVEVDPIATNAQQLIARQSDLKDALEAELSQAIPSLTRLFAIELDQIQLLPDSHIVSRFWSVQDRFRRIVPAATQASYAIDLPGKGEAIWKDSTFIRSQTLALLEVIHSDIMINIYREQSIKRLKLFLFLLVLSTWIAGVVLNNVSSLELLFFAGMLGAATSIINRLQSAVVLDAMTKDGIFEVVGLRLGWVGILMSTLAGGIFALVLYVIVMAGALHLVTPNEAASEGASGTSTSAAAIARIQSQSVNATEPNSGSNASQFQPVNPSDVSTTSSPTQSAAPSPSTLTSPKACSQDKKREDSCEPARMIGVNEPCKGSNENFWCKRSTDLGLATGADFFRMLLLAFLAGFAERLVPDVLNRIGKRYTDS